MEWVISGQFASARPSPADHSRYSARPHYLLSLFCFSEVANYLNAKFYLLLALWLLLIHFFLIKKKKITAKRMQTPHRWLASNCARAVVSGSNFARKDSDVLIQL